MRNCPNACRYQRASSGDFWGEGQQPSHGTGGGAWAKITNAKGDVLKKFKNIWYKIVDFFALYRASLVLILPRHPCVYPSHFYLIGFPFFGNIVFLVFTHLFDLVCQIDAKAQQ